MSRDCLMSLHNIQSSSKAGPSSVGEGRHGSCPPAILSGAKPGLAPTLTQSPIAQSCSEEKFLMAVHTEDTQTQVGKGKGEDRHSQA